MERMRFTWRLLVLAVVAGLILWGVLKNRESRQALATAVGASVTLVDEVQNLPAFSWKAVPLAVPSTAVVEIALEVIRGNAIDVFLVTPDQVDLMKKGQWQSIQAHAEFHAVKTKTYRRTGRLEAGSYYLILRDTTLGILSAKASDIMLKIRLNP